MIQTVFLDVDNTLLDFNACAYAAMKNAFAETGMTFFEDVFSTFLEVNDQLWLLIERGELTRDELHLIRWNTIFKKLDISYNGADFELLFLRNLETASGFIPGAVELLTYLKPKYTLCLASNASYKPQMKRLESSGILTYVDKLFISEVLGYSKPEKDFFDACFRELGDADPKHSIIIGDSISADILGGINYGIKTCWFNPEHKPLPEGIKPDYVVHTLFEIQAIL